MFKVFKKVYIDLSQCEIDDLVSNLGSKSTVYYKNNETLASELFIKGINSLDVKLINDNTDIINKCKPDIIINDTLYDTDTIDICKKLNITIYNKKENKVFCGNCYTNYIPNVTINTTCSQECALRDNPKLLELLKESTETKVKKRISSGKKIKFKSDLTEKEQKQQRNALREAKRHTFIQKREEYIRSMKNPTCSNTPIVPVKKVPEIIIQCKATTKGGKPCSNKAINNSVYCGIVSHKKLDPNYKTKSKKSNKTLDRLKKISKRNATSYTKQMIDDYEEDSSKTSTN